MKNIALAKALSSTSQDRISESREAFLEQLCRGKLDCWIEPRLPHAPEPHDSCPRKSKKALPSRWHRQIFGNAS